MAKELLVVLAAGSADALRATVQRLGARYPVVSTLGARLLVLRAGDAGARAGIAATPGVQAVAADAQDVAGLQGLDETEQLFASAWAAQGLKSGPRPGDGMDWDTPGLQPPHR